MKNFARAICPTFRHRFTIACTILSAVLVAVLWGANIGAVYPFVQVTLRGQSLQQWIDGEIAEVRREITEQSAELERLRGEAERAREEHRPELQSKIRLAETRIESLRHSERKHIRVKPYLDRYLPRDPFWTLALVTVAVIVGTVVKDLCLFFNSVLSIRLAQLATFDLRARFYRRTLRLDLAVFSNEGSADLLSRFTTDSENVAASLQTLFGRLICEPLKMLACLLGAAWISWRLLLLSVVVLPLAALSIHWLSRMLKRSNRQAMEQMARIYSRLQEAFGAFRIVKAFTAERRERRQFHVQAKEYYRKAMKIARYDSLAHPITEMIAMIWICIALLGGTWLVLKGNTHLLGIRMTDRPLDLGSLLLFFGLLAGAADPVNRFSIVLSRLQCGIAASDRIFERLDRKPLVCDPATPVSCRRHHRDLVFQNVSFAYHPGRYVLEEVDFQVRFGETVALIGPNGCGKTTLANLILRFADPTSGTILLDGVPLADMRLRDLRGQIGLVTQEPLLFDDSVYNNIRYGRPAATHDEVIEAARRALAHGFIENDLPDGYDTIVGTLGERLSGGQRQRISLARAILRDPAILVLDEATSQVDLESEQALQRALEAFIRHRTTVIITHRLGILALADRIVAMEAGRIMAVGTHEELTAGCEFYRRLRQCQFENLRRSA